MRLDGLATRKHKFVVYFDKTAPHLHQIVRLKIFLREEAAAIYCYGQVKQLDGSEHGTHVLLDYVRIREDDRELLVRASLHVQSKQLKLRAQERQR